MNNLSNDIGKRMPYRESEEYLDRLIDAATEEAITRHAAYRKTRFRRLMAASAAAVAALIVCFGIGFFNGKSSQSMPENSQSPLDEFLNTLSDEEAAQLTFYEIEEIPEY